MDAPAVDLAASAAANLKAGGGVPAVAAGAPPAAAPPADAARAAETPSVARFPAASAASPLRLAELVAAAAARAPAPAKRTSSEDMLVAWLREHFEESQHDTIARDYLYHQYSLFCQAVMNMQPMNAASLGKLMRSVFPGLSTRRLGARGQSKYHYSNIRLRSVSTLPRTEDYGTVVSEQLGVSRVGPFPSAGPRRAGLNVGSGGKSTTHLAISSLLSLSGTGSLPYLGAMGPIGSIGSIGGPGSGTAAAAAAAAAAADSASDVLLGAFRQRPTSGTSGRVVANPAAVPAAGNNPKTQFVSPTAVSSMPLAKAAAAAAAATAGSLGPLGPFTEGVSSLLKDAQSASSKGTPPLASRQLIQQKLQELANVHEKHTAELSQLVYANRIDDVPAAMARFWSNFPAELAVYLHHEDCVQQLEAVEHVLYSSVLNSLDTVLLEWIHPRLLRDLERFAAHIVEWHTAAVEGNVPKRLQTRLLAGARVFGDGLRHRVSANAHLGQFQQAGKPLRAAMAAASPDAATARVPHGSLARQLLDLFWSGAPASQYALLVVDAYLRHMAGVPCLEEPFRARSKAYWKVVHSQTVLFVSAAAAGAPASVGRSALLACLRPLHAFLLEFAFLVTEKGVAQNFCALSARYGACAQFINAGIVAGFTASEDPSWTRFYASSVTSGSDSVS